MSSRTNNKNSFKNIKMQKNKAKSKSKTKDKFIDANPAGTYTDFIDLLSVSVSADDKNAVKFEDQLTDYFILVMKYLFLVGILSLNFLGLSVSLNCNADQELSQRILSAVFAFFFGFVYLIINYYTYKVLGQGKICKMNRDILFPFKV